VIFGIVDLTGRSATTAGASRGGTMTAGARGIALGGSF